MARRLLTVVLNAAILLGSVVGGPCATRATCAMARARHADCCATAQPGIHAPRCCAGAPQLADARMAATTDRPLPEARTTPSVVVVACSAPAPSAGQSGARLYPERAPAPPGRTLIAQHTSLLL